MEPFELLQSSGQPSLLHIKGWSVKSSTLSAGFTTRHGGGSEDPYSSLNTAFHVGDDPAAVVSNRKRLSDALKVPFSSWTCAEQIHGNQVEIVSRNLMGKGRLSVHDTIAGKDALVTNEKGVWLTALFADCVPIYFFDPVRHVVALAHAGWRGTAGNIAGQVVHAMTTEFACRPTDIFAVIGPSIRICCYEVDEAVMSSMRQLTADLSPAELEQCYRTKGNDKTMLSLQEINRHLLVKAGILPVHIEISHLCTSCNTQLFFSYRKENGRTGRMAAWIGIELKR